MYNIEIPIRKIGNGVGLVLDEKICSELGIGQGDSVLLHVEEDRLTVVPRKVGTSKPRFGIAAGRKLVDDDFFSEERDKEIEELFGIAQ